MLESNAANSDEATDKSHIAIHAQNVTLSLGEGDARVDILGGIDLSIETGKTVALLGPSGSGKSSLMAILSGLERASSGSVNIAGADFGKMNEDELAVARRGRVGIVLQAFHLLPTMTALENVAVPLELDGQDEPFAIAAKELDAVGLADRLGHYPTQLSGGEQQRVAIARAMGSRPSIIFADEPTGNLDQATGEKIIELLFDRQKASEATLLIITHDPELAKRCDRIVELRDGLIDKDSAA
ncbi:ABC-type antimicrobial peptide transport system, ATPase component [hydrothermal vent metagenome]|uniref:ABC-type antimicrobial peptide transport system, ATPase component n=1 Tax=hydrothermal vent metagenome TaxID=652676 RepID=A0A3B0RUZ5_9ZZZZ